MQYGRDLSWLSAPAFFLILGILAINTKKQNTHSRQPEKLKTVILAPAVQKPL
jgi:hypothetical protein